MKINLLVLTLTLTSLISCGKNNQNIEEVQDNTPLNVQLGPGTYKISCFYNKPASQGIGTPIYTISTLTLNNSNTGSNTYELYSNSACTTLLQSGSLSLAHYETIKVGGENVLLMDQDDGNSITRVWIGYKRANGLNYMDVDYNNVVSGPYMVEPTSAELSQFMADPAGKGILLQDI